MLTKKNIIIANAAYSIVAGILMGFYVFIFRVKFSITDGVHIVSVLGIAAAVSFISCVLFSRAKLKPISYVIVICANLIFVALGFLGVFPIGLFIYGIILSAAIAYLNGERIDKITIAVFVACFTVAAVASTFSVLKYKVVGTEYYVRENGGFTLTESRGENVVIPKKIGSTPVKKIAKEAFSVNALKIDIAPGIEIVEGALRLCDNLAELTVDLSNYNLGYLFYAHNRERPDIAVSTKLTTVNLYGETLSRNAMNYLPRITTVNFLNEMKTIELSAFEGCIGLKDFKLPPSVEEIGDRSFFGCTSIAPFELHEGLRIIGTEAFGTKDLFPRSGDNHIEIIIPSTVIYMGKSVFLNQHTENKTLFVLIHDESVLSGWEKEWNVSSYDADGAPEIKIEFDIINFNA